MSTQLLRYETDQPHHPSGPTAAGGYPGEDRPTEPSFEDTELLDAYSDAVTGVFDAVSPSVVHLGIRQEVMGRGGQRLEGMGSGSGVLITPDGYLITNNHVVERANRIEVALSDGRVLVVGGFALASDGFHAALLQSVELFDPTAGTFSVLGGLNAGHVNPSATLLSDGKVLVAGGVLFSTSGESIPLSTVELFDPATGRWSTLPPMNQARAGHTYTLLPDGRVLVIGGATREGPLASAEIFDPLTRTWTLTAPIR